MIEFIKRLWESTSFRLTLNYSILAIFTTLFLIGFFYVQVFGALRDEHLRQINVAVQRLSIAYEVGGREEILRVHARGFHCCSATLHTVAVLEDWLLIDPLGRTCGQRQKCHDEESGAHGASMAVRWLAPR